MKLVTKTVPFAEGAAVRKLLALAVLVVLAGCAGAPPVAEGPDRQDRRTVVEGRPYDVVFEAVRSAILSLDKPQPGAKPSSSRLRARIVSADKAAGLVTGELTASDPLLGYYVTTYRVTLQRVAAGVQVDLRVQDASSESYRVYYTNFWTALRRQLQQ